MSSAHLTTGRLNVGILQEEARKQLLCLLEKCDGTKVSEQPFLLYGLMRSLLLLLFRQI